MGRSIVVAIANFFFPGLGYVLLGKRSIFGWMFISAVRHPRQRRWLDEWDRLKDDRRLPN